MLRVRCFVGSCAWRYIQRVTPSILDVLTMETVLPPILMSSGLVFLAEWREQHQLAFFSGDVMRLPLRTKFSMFGRASFRLSAAVLMRGLTPRLLCPPRRRLSFMGVVQEIL